MFYKPVNCIFWIQCFTGGHLKGPSPATVQAGIWGWPFAIQQKSQFKQFPTSFAPTAHLQSHSMASHHFSCCRHNCFWGCDVNQNKKNSTQLWRKTGLGEESDHSAGYNNFGIRLKEGGSTETGHNYSKTVLPKPSYLKLWPQQLEKQELTWASARTHQNKNNFTFTVQIAHFVNRETTFPKRKEWRSIKKILKILGLPQRKELCMYVNKEQIDQDYMREVLANIIISDKSFFTRCLHILTIWSQSSQLSRQTMKICIFILGF